jgi:hypothetical protein
MNLTEEEKQYYLNQEKGYEGEKRFDELTKNLGNDLYILNDLLLKTNNTHFQIDTLIISQSSILPIEIKYFNGDHYYQSESFFKIPKKEIQNPLQQLRRSESLLRQFLRNLGYHGHIEPYLVFNNPEFTLYQAPLNEPIIYPTQVNRFIGNLENTPSKLNSWHMKLAEQIISKHITESPYTLLPSYDYDQQKKGITCASCHSFNVTANAKKLVCDKCGNQEEIDSAILRSAEELKLLFPNRKITTRTIQEWCVVISSKKIIRRVLLENYKGIGFGKGFYFE